MSLKIIDEFSNTTYFLTEVTPKFNSNEFCFELSDSSGIKVYIDYVLALSADYKPEDYSLFIFKSWILNGENNIFQAYEKDINERIGWIFPIQSLVSTDHKYVDDPHFLKYAYVTFYKLLMNQEQHETFTTYLQTTDSYRLTDFYGNDIIILVLSNTKIQKIENFHIDNYLTSLYSYSYYYCQPIDNFKRIGCRASFQSPGDTRLILQRNSIYLQGEVYLHRLFKSLLKTEEHPLVRFYLLYQVIELIIEIIFQKSFLEKINTFQNNTDRNIYELKESIAYISSEKERISKLITSLEKYFDGNTKTNLLLYCNDLLISFNSETKTSLALALYSVRSLIVHKFRKLPEENLPKIAEINQEFENILIKIILNYEETSI